jgi:hypothetical protein
MIRKGSLLIVVLFLTGCTTLPSRLEMDYGNSFRMAKTGQILNPEAGKNLEPVMGFDGRATLLNVEKYRKGFEEAVPVERAFIMVPGQLGK